MARLLSQFRYQLVVAALVLVVLAQPFGLHFSPRMISRSAFLVWVMQAAILVALVVGVGVAGLGSWLLQTPAVRSSCRRWCLTLALLMVAGVGLSGGAVLLKRGLPYGAFLAPFDQAAWRDPGSANFIPGDLTPRQKMLGGVVRRVLKPGGQAATREAIVAQLGPSEDSELFASMGHDLIYHLGPQHDSMFAIDEDWLLIWLDESGRFLRFEIRAD